MPKWNRRQLSRQVKFLSEHKLKSLVSFRWRGEKSKKCPLALASDLKNYTKVTAPTTATEGTDGLDNVTLQKLKHYPPSLHSLLCNIRLRNARKGGIR
jgi:hypothetical protein